MSLSTLTDLGTGLNLLDDPPVGVIRPPRPLVDPGLAGLNPRCDVVGVAVPGVEMGVEEDDVLPLYLYAYAA